MKLNDRASFPTLHDPFRLVRALPGCAGMPGL
jgi:hypothetical protein